MQLSVAAVGKPLQAGPGLGLSPPPQAYGSVFGGWVRYHEFVSTDE